MLSLSKVNQGQFVNSFFLNQIAENLLEIFTKQKLYKNRGNMFAKNFIRFQLKDVSYFLKFLD